MRRIVPALFPATAIQPAPVQTNTWAGPGAAGRAPAVTTPVPTGPIDEKVKVTFSLGLVYLLWAVVLMDPQWFIAAKGLMFVVRLPQLLFGLLALVAVTGRMNRGWSPYLLGFLLVGVAGVPGAYDQGFAKIVLKQLLLYYILTVGTLTVVRNVKDAVPIVMMLLFQHLWWGLHSRTSGVVGWHPTNANFDAYGPQMVIGLALSYYFGMAAASKRTKMLATFMSGLCIIGIVASFARGAVLSAGLVAIILWIRSPRKGRATIGGIGATVLVVVGSAVLFPDGTFWTEMQSAFTEGTEEGTGSDRKMLWDAAWKVYKKRPIVGTAPDNFGPFAAATFKVGEVDGTYGENPGRMYTRQLHSIFFQILSETGTLGSLMFLAMLRDFWRRNKRMRRKDYGAAWASGTRQYQLKPLALGLESAMIAYLASGFFYDQLFVHWFYTILAANLLLCSVTEAAMRDQTAAAPMMPRRG